MSFLSELPPFSEQAGHPVLDRLLSLRDEIRSQHRTDPAKSRELSLTALALLPSVSTDARVRLLLEADLRHDLAAAHERLAEFSEVLKQVQLGYGCLEAVRSLCGDASELIALHRIQSDLLVAEGNAHDRLGDHVRSLGCFQRNVEVSLRVPDETLQARALGQRARAYYRLGDFTSALECCLEALPIHQRLNDAHNQGCILNDVGNIHYSQDEFEEARAAYARALSLFQTLDEPYWQAGLLGNLAGAELKCGRPETALELHRQGLEIRERLGERHGQAHSWLGLGTVYGELGELDTAVSACRHALGLFQEVADQTGTTAAHRGLATALEAAGDLEGAIQSVETALPLAEQCGLRELEYQLHEQLSRLREARGEFQQALEHQKRFHQVREALFSERNQRRMNAMQVRLQVAQARHEARIDPLTGLLNRRSLEEELERLRRLALEWKQPLCLALVDIDQFKQINDAYSHAVGDAVLQAVAHELRQTFGQAAVLARHGGDEFSVALTGLPVSVMEQRCMEFCLALREREWHHLHPEVRVTASVGACCSGQVEGSLEDLGLTLLLREADARLYAAKAAGRDQAWLRPAPP